MDDKDRHVVAAALSARAGLLVTDNFRHFPKAWLAERNIELITSSDLFIRLALEHPEALAQAHRLTVANSPKTEEAILDTLRAQIGAKAADAVRAVILG